MNRILIAFIIVLLLSNVATAVGWAVSAGKLSVPTGMVALAGPNKTEEKKEESPGPEKKKKKKLVDPDEDDSPAPRSDDAVAPTDEEDDTSMLDRVGSAFSDLKSAVMMH